MKRLSLLIPVAIFGLLLFWARLSKYNDFHKANIDGPIDTIYRYKDYVMIYVNKIEYRILPVSLDKDPQFDKIAKTGDSLYKRSKSDTLRLMHESDEAFYYTVRKW